MAVRVQVPLRVLAVRVQVPLRVRKGMNRYLCGLSLFYFYKGLYMSHLM